MARKTRVLTKTEAVARVNSIYPVVLRETKLALEVEAVMESANDFVRGNIDGTTFDGARAYNIVSRTLAAQLALIVAKLFEQPRTRGKQTLNDRLNRSEVASIPLLLRLMRQKRIRSHFGALARDWNFPDMAGLNERSALRAIDEALSIWSRARSSARLRLALRRVSAFRNEVVAHALVTSPTLTPIYDDLRILVDAARDIVEKASLGIAGDNSDLREREHILREDADDFWRPALLAVSGKESELS